VTSVLRLSICMACTLLISFAAAPFHSTSVEAAGTRCLPAALKSRLSQIRSKFGRVRVMSTYRGGARIAGTRKASYHASCRAVDFMPPKGKYRQVASWLKSVHGGGVGTYSCGMHHIHIDNGPRIRFHKCVSRRRAETRTFEGLKQAAQSARKALKAASGDAKAAPRSAAIMVSPRAPAL
jgi:hypothetical protein